MKLILIIFVLNNGMSEVSGDIENINMNMAYVRQDLDPGECVFMAAEINNVSKLEAGNKWAACAPDLDTLR